MRQVAKLSPMSWAPGIDWNHNDFYHPFLLRQVPAGATRALDVGCGAGGFARMLATRVASVDAIDRDVGALDLARKRSASVPNIEFREADLLSDEIGTYDFISCIAVVHHMPFREAVARMRDALRPDGVLAILGLSRMTPAAMAYGAITVPADVVMGIRYRLARHPLNGIGVDAPVKEPEMSASEIKAAAREILPGARYRRHLFYRYSLVYENRSL